MRHISPEPYAEYAANDAQQRILLTVVSQYSLLADPKQAPAETGSMGELRCIPAPVTRPKPILYVITVVASEAAPGIFASS